MELLAYTIASYSRLHVICELLCEFEQHAVALGCCLWHGFILTTLRELVVSPS